MTLSASTLLICVRTAVVCRAAAKGWPRRRLHLGVQQEIAVCLDAAAFCPLHRPGLCFDAVCRIVSRVLKEQLLSGDVAAQLLRVLAAEGGRKKAVGHMKASGQSNRDSGDVPTLEHRCLWAARQLCRGPPRRLPLPAALLLTKIWPGCKPMVCPPARPPSTVKWVCG